MGRQREHRGPTEPAQSEAIQNLDQYLLAYGPMLGKQAERSLDPLHVPGRDPGAASGPAAGAVRGPSAMSSKRPARPSSGRRRSCWSGKWARARPSWRWPQSTPTRQDDPIEPWCSVLVSWSTSGNARSATPSPDAEVIQIESWKSLLHLDKDPQAGQRASGTSLPGIAPSWARNGNRLATGATTWTTASCAVRAAVCAWLMKTANRFSLGQPGKKDSRAPGSGSGVPGANGC